MRKCCIFTSIIIIIVITISIIITVSLCHSIFKSHQYPSLFRESSESLVRKISAAGCRAACCVPGWVAGSHFMCECGISIPKICGRVRVCANCILHVGRAKTLHIIDCEYIKRRMAAFFARMIMAMGDGDVRFSTWCRWKLIASAS